MVALISHDCRVTWPLGNRHYRAQIGGFAEILRKIKIHEKIDPIIAEPLLFDSTVKNTLSKVCSEFLAYSVEIPQGTII